MKNLLPILFIILTWCCIVSAQALPELEKVRQIKLLEHTRDDVRQIFTDFTWRLNPIASHVDVFETGNAHLEVSYSDGKCSPGDSYEWEVSEWKVTQIKIEPYKDWKLDKLGIYLSKYQNERQFLNHQEPKVHHRKDLGILIETWESIVTSITFDPPKKYYLSRCDKKLAKRLLSTSSYFDPDFKERIAIRCSAPPPVDVTNLILSRTEITQNLNQEEQIPILTVAENPDNYRLTYHYSVTGGKIIKFGDKPIHENDKVLWDLSDVKPGTYNITVAVDNGCGFCGKTMTKTVTIKDCVNCVKP